MELGSSLIEVVISMLLIGMMSAMVMPVFLSGRMSGGRSTRRVAAADAIRRVEEELRGYVTADRSVAGGPGTGPDGWSLPGDRSGRWALAPGQHALDSAVWAAALVPYQGEVSYTVSVRFTPSGPQPDVVFRAFWAEP